MKIDAFATLDAVAARRDARGGGDRKSTIHRVR
jgi:hypothetical protein